MITLNDYLYSGDTVFRILKKYSEDLKRAAEEVDENVFLMFMETSEVFGEGFRNVSEQK